MLRIISIKVEKDEGVARSLDEENYLYLSGEWAQLAPAVKTVHEDSIFMFGSHRYDAGNASGRADAHRDSGQAECHTLRGVAQWGVDAGQCACVSERVSARTCMPARIH